MNNLICQSAKNSLPDKMSTTEKVNILLVDDRRENLLALESILKDLDENLVKAASGVEALKYLLKNEVAVILLDVEMPIMDGFQTATLIRERQKTNCSVVIGANVGKERGITHCHVSAAIDV